MNSETMDKETIEGTAQPRPVLHILVIGFHHQRGAEVEFVYPKFQDGNLTKSLPAPWHPLLYVALPDGAHNYEADCIFFSLPSLKDDNTEQPGQVFGVACFQQIDSKDLKVKDDDVTRTSVQKSVVLILKKPLFGFILSKLNLITQAYFNEKDFSQTTILKDTYTALNQTLSTSKLNVSMFYIDLSLGDLVIKLKQKVLLLIKLILMEKKVVFWGCPVGMVCTTMLSLLSLLPGFYNSGIFHDPDERKEPNEINEGSKDQYGLPLEIFGEEYKLHPYISMQQMNSLKSDDSKGYVVGSSNLLFKHRTHLMWDALVDLEKNELVIPENDLNQSLSLTTEDLRFADFITSSVSEYRNNSGISWDGSDEWIRLQFKYYILCLLASTAPEKGSSSHIHKQFNEEFITNWKQTNNYKQWIEQKHLGLESIYQGHPFEGGLTMSDIKLRIQSRIDALSISDESREKIGAAVKKTGQVVGSALNSAKNAISSWRGWFSGIVQEINDEMQANSVNLELVNSNDEEIDGSSEELSHGMIIRERTGNGESA